MESNHGIIDSTITLRPGRYSVSGAAPGRRWCWAWLSPPLAWGAEEQMPLYSSSAHPRAALQPPSHLQSPNTDGSRPLLGLRAGGVVPQPCAPSPFQLMTVCAWQNTLNMTQQPQDAQLLSHRVYCLVGAHHTSKPGQGDGT